MINHWDRPRHNECRTWAGRLAEDPRAVHEHRRSRHPPAHSRRRHGRVWPRKRREGRLLQRRRRHVSHSFFPLELTGVRSRMVNEAVLFTPGVFAPEWATSRRSSRTSTHPSPPIEPPDVERSRGRTSARAVGGRREGWHPSGWKGVPQRGGLWN